LRKLILSSLLLLFLVLASTYMANAQPTVTIKGFVKTYDGKPHNNTLVVVFDAREFTIKGLVKTDPEGLFSVTVPQGGRYLVYIFPLTEDGKGLSHVPEMIDLSFEDLKEAVVNFTIYPAAFVHVSGMVMYVGGEWRGYYVVEVLGAEGKPLRKVLDAGKAIYKREFEVGKVFETKPLIIDVYGRGSPFIVVYRRGLREKKLPEGILTVDTVIVPAYQDVIVKVETSVIDRRRPPFLQEPIRKLVFTLGDPLKPLNLKSGEVTVLDLLWESLKRVIEDVRRDVAITEMLIEELESIGFYLAPERTELSKAVALVEEARVDFENRQPAEQILEKLEKAYVIATQSVAGRLFFLKTVALEGAPMLSYFIGAFAVTMAFYFFEDPRKKFLSFVAFFALFLLIFVYAYPGFPLLWSNRRDLFLISVGSAFLGIAFLIFYLPSKVKEAELPGALRKGSIAAITFSIAKRFSRLKKTRTLITVFSLAALIWAFTVLASISSVYGIWSEDVPSNIRGNFLLIKHVVSGTTPSPLGFFSDYKWLEGKVGKENMAVRVFNDPQQILVITVTKGKVKYTGIKAILGLSPVEDKVTGISRILIEGNVDKLSQPNAIYIPSTLARKLEVRVGDSIEITVYRRGLEVPKVETCIVAGIFDEARLDLIVDIDGDSIKPLVKVKGKFAPANSTDILIMNWEYLVKEVLVEKGAELSAVFQIYEIVVLGEPKVLKELANSYIERKGEDYYAYVNIGDRCIKLFFGQKVENILTSNIDFVVPILIVVFNVLVSMYSIVNERRREIFVFNAIGFNPMHIAILFLAESIVYGLISGGLGYIAGLVTFRLMTVTARTQNLLVREKLEWYWSIVAILISVLVAMIASFKPALNAAMMYTPSKVRRIKMQEKEREEREERILTTYAGKTYSLPVKVKEDEAVIFFSYLYTRLKDLETGYRERVENLEEFEEEEMPDGRLVKRFSFNYIFVTDKERIVTENEVQCSKSPKEKIYRIELYSRPHERKEIPIQYMDRVASVINDILKSWKEERRLILKGFGR